MHVKDVTRSNIGHFKTDIRSGKTATTDTTRSRGRTGNAVVTGGPGVANRCHALASKMSNLAEVWEWREKHTNPCRLNFKYQKNQR